MFEAVIEFRIRIVKTTYLSHIFTELEIFTVIL